MPQLPSPIQSIYDPLFEQKGLEVYVKREDLIHPLIMGNKWRKLKHNIREAKAHGFKQLVTMGGAFSNHILATAAAAKENNLQCMGIIRGEELNAGSNPTLRQATGLGMQLQFVDREKYRYLREDPSEVSKQFPDDYFLPEGGTNQQAIKGCAELVDEIEMDFDFICTPIGTGGTMAGILEGLKAKSDVLGISSLKGDFVHSMMINLLDQHKIAHNNYQIFDQYHFGGYGKTTDVLIDFIEDFRKKHLILLDPIYTGKLFYGVIDLIKQDFFKFNHKIILLHTGGIQGIEGYNIKNRRKIS